MIQLSVTGTSIDKRLLFAKTHETRLYRDVQSYQKGAHNLDPLRTYRGHTAVVEVSLAAAFERVFPSSRPSHLIHFDSHRMLTGTLRMTGCLLPSVMIGSS